MVGEVVAPEFTQELKVRVAGVPFTVRVNEVEVVAVPVLGVAVNVPL